MKTNKYISSKEKFKYLRERKIAKRLVIYDDDRCDICNRKFERNGFKYNVDHCHKSGHVRGLLCSKCNLLLGLCEDNTGILASAIYYLERFPVVFKKEEKEKRICKRCGHKILKLENHINC